MADSPREKWRFKAGAILAASPALGPDGTVYAGCRDGKLYAVAGDGTLRWTVDTAGPVDAAACVLPDGLVVFGSYDGQLRAVDPAGAVAWSLDVGAPVMTTPCVDDDGQLWFGTDSGRLMAVSAAGKVLARITVTDLLSASPVSVAGSVFVADRRLFGSDGTRAEVAAEPIVAECAPGEDGTLYVGSWDGHVYAIKDGAVLWKTALDGQIYAGCAVGPDGQILAASRQGEVVALSPAGERLWTRKLKDGVYGTPAITSGGAVWVGSNSNWLHQLSLESGHKEFSAKLGRDLRSSPALADDGTVYVASWDWHLYAFESPLGGPAASPWPQFHGSAARQGRWSPPPPPPGDDDSAA